MKFLPLLIFWSLWFVNYSSRSTFSPLLPLIEDSLLLSHGEAGGLFTALAAGSSLTLIMSGRLASWWGYKKTVFAGFIGTALVLFALQWANTYIGFYALFFFLGIASGSYIPSILPIITDTYEHKHWGKAIGFHDSAASLSIFSIPVIAAFSLRFLQWRDLLLILAFLTLALSIPFWSVAHEPGHNTPRVQTTRYFDLLKKRSTWIVGTLWVFSTASCAGVYAIIPLYLVSERGIQLTLANTLFGMSRLGGVFVSILIGFLTDRYGHKRMLTYTVLITGLSTIALSMSNTLPLIVGALVVQATVSIAFFPVGMATLSKLTPLGDRSTVLGFTMAMGSAFGIGMTPFLLGVTADHFSFGLGILVLGILTTLSSLAIPLLREA